jgi:hypothetical protein
MGAAHREGVGGRIPPRGLQAPRQEPPAANGGLAPGHAAGARFRRGPAAPPQPRHPHRREQPHLPLLPPRARGPLQPPGALPAAQHIHLLRNRPRRLQPVQRAPHLRQRHNMGLPGPGHGRPRAPHIRRRRGGLHQAREVRKDEVPRARSSSFTILLFRFYSSVGSLPNLLFQFVPLAPLRHSANIIQLLKL